MVHHGEFDKQESMIFPVIKLRCFQDLQFAMFNYRRIHVPSGYVKIAIENGHL